jgi:hypothetical protein
VTDPHRQLVQLYDRLPTEQARQLLEFAEFLDRRYGTDRSLSAAPEAIPRPSRETVIAAVKRLSATYPMLDKSKVLHEASDLVSQHLIGGREAASVIDDLEAVFERHYRRLTEARTGAAS